MAYLVPAQAGAQPGALFLKITKLKQLAPKTSHFTRIEGQRLWALSERLAGHDFTQSGLQMPAAVQAKPRA
jgi:hypothetical protein